MTHSALQAGCARVKVTGGPELFVDHVARAPSNTVGTSGKHVNRGSPLQSHVDVTVQSFINEFYQDWEMYKPPLY